MASDCTIISIDMDIRNLALCNIFDGTFIDICCDLHRMWIDFLYNRSCHVYKLTTMPGVCTMIPSIGEIRCCTGSRPVGCTVLMISLALFWLMNTNAPYRGRLMCVPMKHSILICSII